MSRKWVIQQIVAMETDGADLSEDAVRVAEPELHRAASDHFSSWETALEYAGIGHGDRITTDPSEAGVSSKLRHMCLTGCSLDEDHVQRRDDSFHAAAVRIHGSWIKALRSVGINAERVGPYAKADRPSDNQILDRIRSRHSAGQSIRHCDVCFEDAAFARWVKNRYGSWRAAVEAAGVDD